MSSLALAAFAAAALSAHAAPVQTPPAAPVRPVTDTYFGVPVVDPYRYMENLDDPAVKAWMKAQADYARADLDGIRGRAKMLAAIKKYVNAVPATVSSVSRTVGDLFFFLKTPSGKSLASLYVRRGASGKDVLLVNTEKFAGPRGEPAAINYYAPSDDGRYVAFGVSQGGSEMAALHVLDVKTRKVLPETIDRAEYGDVAWRADGRSFFYNRLQKMGPGSSQLDKYRDSKVFLHVLGDSPDKDVAVFGRGVSDKTPMEPDDQPVVVTQTGSDYAVGAIEHGVQLEQTLYVAPVASLGKPDVPWVKLCDTDAQVTDFTYRGDEAYLLTHKDAARFKIVRASLSRPDAPFEAFLPETKGVLKTLTAASDALYVSELDDGLSDVVRVAYDGAASRVKLPFEGAVEIYGADARLPGIVFELTSWTKGPRIDVYDPGADKVARTDIRPAGPYDDLDILASTEAEAPAYDGALVPVSIVYKKGLKLDGTNPAVLWAYGAYGITEDPFFSEIWLAWLEHGGVFALAHVRGGGERGESWHQAGYKLTKPNTWRDTIAAAEYLIARKYTSASKLGLVGGSAGGITVGRAITERPDLFAAAAPEVGCLNPLRQELSPNGPPNIPEFGSVRTQEGFEDLYAMDSLHHVRDGAAYPATMITTGLNDPRVASWQPAKFYARLRAATSSGRPVLLRVDYQNGHGIGESRLQSEIEHADLFSFFLRQFGDPEFRN